MPLARMTRFKQLSKNEKTIEECVESWFRAVGKSDFEVGQQICDFVMSRCRSCLADGSTGKDTYLVVGILFHGLQHVAELQASTVNEDWLTDTRTVAKVWELSWDAEDRLGYAVERVEFPRSELNDHLKGRLLDQQNIRSQIDSVYGDGWFVSPEIIVKTTYCSICEQDCRKCEHISGRFYDGNICRAVVREVEDIGDTALVRHPEDPRCRIWPWMKDVSKDGGIVFKGIPILCCFELDAFRHADDSKT